MSGPLPGWVTSNDESVLREVADFRELQPAERAVLLRAACEAAASLLAARPDGEAVAAYRDPVPLSSRLALERLRHSARAA